MSPNPVSSHNHPREVLSRVWAWGRTQGLQVVAKLGINFALPYLIYVRAERPLGQVLALIAASSPPMLWSVVGLARHRRVDALSILALTGIALSWLAFFGGGGVTFLRLRERLVTAVIGLIFLGSVAVGRPLMYQLARARVRTRSSSEANAFDAMREHPVFRRVMVIMTLVWGTVLLAEAAISAGLIFVLSIRQYMIVSHILGWGTLSITTAWTYWFAYHRLTPLASPPMQASAPARPAPRDTCHPIVSHSEHDSAQLPSTSGR